MAGGEEPPLPNRRSWAEVLGSTLPPDWNKNILEVILQKNGSGPFKVSDDDCAKLLRKIGLQVTQGGEIEAVQICPNGRGVILITLKSHIAPDSYTCHNVIEVNNHGVSAVNVRPAGKSQIELFTAFLVRVLKRDCKMETRATNWI